MTAIIPGDSVISWAGDELSEDYVALLTTHGGELCNDRVRLYDAAELIERNETYETQKYCPGFITIGDDSGGQAIVIALGKNPGPVYMVDHGSMNPDDFEVIAPDIETWAVEGYATGGPEEETTGYHVIVRWEGKPSPSALKILREQSPLARDMSLADLSGVFCGKEPFNLGVVAENRRTETLRQLADAGFIVNQEAIS